MATQRILNVSNPNDEVVLRSVSENVEVNDITLQANQHLVDNLVATMQEKKGCGIAAPQVGVLQRIIVIEIPSAAIEGIPEDVCATEGYHPFSVTPIINPVVEIIDSTTVYSAEGCLSFRSDRVERVRRAKRIRVTGFDRNGKPFALEAEGLLARAIQHEVDHLNGIVIDRSAIPGAHTAIEEWRETWKMKTLAEGAAHFLPEGEGNLSKTPTWPVPEDLNADTRTHAEIVAAEGTRAYAERADPRDVEIKAAQDLATLENADTLRGLPGSKILDRDKE